ncbi:Hypothetical predicted protein, partial [Cloeon dipterum]
TAEMELVARRAAEADAARAAAAEEDERRRKRDSESARIALLEAQRAFEEEARRSAALAAEEARRAAEANMERLVAEAAAEARKAAAAEAARSAAQAMEEARRVSEAEAAKMVAEQQRYFAQAEAQRLALQAAEDARKAAEAETMKLAAQAAEEARRAAEAENARRAAEAARIEAEIEAAKKAAEKDAALRAAAEAAAQEELMKAKLQAHREESTQTLPSAFPPKFIESLNSAVITEGSDFAFQCRVTGEPDPNIEWLRNGSSIENNPRYLISRMAEGICKLEITKTLQDDAGRFSCRAINEAGRAEVEATLSVKEPVPTVSPPTFTKTLESARVKEGSSHQLECIVHGYPLPTVQWYKNGVCVDSSPDYTIGFNNGHAVLVLDEVSLEDEATFLCQAYNRLGNCRSEANLIVEPKVRSKAPIFLMPLLASTALVGEKYEIHCEIEASPEPIFSWSKDGLPIDQSKEVKVVRDGDKFKCFLSVPQVIPQDSGVYVISAKNVAGEAVSSCNISVKEILKHAPAPPMELESQVTKPVIKMQLKDADAEEGDQFKLDTIISGDPEPEVIWYHNGSPVKESKYVQLGFKGDRCTLLVKHVTTDDAGEYKVVAINSGGEVSSTCSVQIRGKAAEFFAEPPRIVGFPPKFTVLLSDILVPEGETAKLECEVEGKPTPQIQWLINNNPISATDGVSMVHDEESGKVSLVINDAQVVHRGVYTAKAINSLGNAKCFAHLIVRSHQDSDTPEFFHKALVQAKPSFKEQLHDQCAFHGDSAKFECIVVGKPMPKVKWMFNDTPVSGRDFLISTSGQRQVLTIPETRQDLVGMYTCVAENDVGRAMSSARLKVEAIPEEFLEIDQGALEQTPVQSSSFTETSHMTVQGSRTETETRSFHENRNRILQMQRVEQVHVVGNEQPVSQRQFSTEQPPTALLVPKERKPVAPKFISPLNGKIVDQGDNILLEGIVDGHPTPNVTWLKNGSELPSNCEVTFKHNKVSLMIKEVAVNDAGKYTCKAENEAGYASSTADIVVKKTIFPPVIARRLQAQMIGAGERARLEVEVAGTPEPTVNWFKDGVSLETIPGIAVKQQGCCHYVVIDQANFSHSGMYSVKAVNSGGEAISSADFLVVDAKPEITLEVKKLVFEDIEEEKRLLEPQPVKQEVEVKTQSNVPATQNFVDQITRQSESTFQSSFQETSQTMSKTTFSSTQLNGSEVVRNASPAPGGRLPNPQGIAMEKLWTPSRAECNDRPMSPRPGSRQDTLRARNDVPDRSASPRPSNEALQMEKLWAHKMETKSYATDSQSTTQQTTTTDVREREGSAGLKKQTWPPQSSFDSSIKQTTVPWRKEESHDSFSQIKTEVKENSEPLMVPTPAPFFQPIKPEVRHYIAETTDLVHKTKYETEDIKEEMSITRSSESTQEAPPNPNVVTDRGVKPSEAKKRWGQMDTSPPMPRAPKSSPAQARKVQQSPDSHRSISPVFTVKAFEPFPQLEPFPFEPAPEGPKKDRVPPPPTPSRFEKGSFVERDGSNEEFKIPPKWKPTYESDSEDIAYRKVQPPSSAQIARARSTGAEALPPTQFETPAGLVSSLGRYGLTLSDFSSALGTTSTSSSSFSSTRVEQHVRSTSSTAEFKSSAWERSKKTNIDSKKYYFEPISKVENESKRDVIVYSCTTTATTHQLHKNEPNGGMQFKKVEHSYQQVQAEKKPAEVRVPKPKFKVPKPSKFVRGEHKERGYESDSEVVKFKPKWKPSSEDLDDPQYRKVVPRLPSPKPRSQRPTSCVTPSYFDHDEPPLMPLERRYSDVQQRTVFAGARDAAKRQMSEMNQDFKRKAQQYMTEIKSAIRKPQNEANDESDVEHSEPRVYREEKRQSNYGAKQIDPDTGLIYFNYDFGYEFGLVLPGEKRIAKQGGTAAKNKTYPLLLPDEKDSVEFPIIHERSGSKEDEKYHTLPRAFKQRVTDGSKDVIAHFEPRARSISPVVKDDGVQLKEPPVFITPLRDIAVKTGSVARIECIVQGEPQPSITWSKDGRLLGTRPSLKMFFRNGLCRLQISDASPDDSGKYTCTATNAMGTAHSSAKVAIL